MEQLNLRKLTLRLSAVLIAAAICFQPIAAKADIYFDNVYANSFNGALIGNADTATELANSPTQCPAGEYAVGIDTFANLVCDPVDGLPTQAGNSGKFLTTDGTNPSWATVDALPSQTGNSGKLLTTNGTAASWASDITVGSGIVTALGFSGPLTGNVTGNVTGTAANVTGIVAIANGGTGQTAKTAAFDALSPNTTKGDLVVHDGTNNVRRPVCTADETLVADSSETSGWRCQIANLQVGGEWMGRITYAAAANCNWENNSGSYANFAAEANCGTAVVDPKSSSAITAPAAKTPSIGVNVNERFNYKFVITSDIGRNGTSTRCSFRMSDGTDSSNAGTFSGTDSGERIPMLDFNLNPSTSGAKEFHLQARMLSGTSCDIYNSLTDQGNFTIDVYRAPRSSSSTVDIFAAGDYGPTAYTMTIGGTTSAPTKGTASLDAAFHSRSGKFLRIQYDLIQTATGSSGTGTYLFPLPSGLSIDSSVQSLSTSTVVSPVGFGKITVGSGYAGGAAYNCQVYPYNATNLSIACLDPNSTSGEWVALGSTSFALGSGADRKYSFKATVPISGWSTFPIGVATGKAYYANILCSSSSAINFQQTPAWISSVGNISSGSCAVTFTGSPFPNANYSCTANRNQTNLLHSETITGKTTSGFSIQGIEFNGSSAIVASAYNVDIICRGDN